MDSKLIINLSKSIINISNTYIVDRDKKDKKIIELVNLVKEEINYKDEKSAEDIYALSLFLQALNTTKSFKDVNEKDLLMEEIFNLI